MSNIPDDEEIIKKLWSDKQQLIGMILRIRKECSFNVSALSRSEALKKWNGFKVWEMVRGIK